MIGQRLSIARSRMPTAQRRDEIVVAAARLFREVGYVPASIDEIARNVGISGPAIYRHFKGKSAILISVIERAVAHAEEQLSRHDFGTAQEKSLEWMAAELVDLSLDQANSLVFLRVAAPDLTECDRSKLQSLGHTIRDLIMRTLSSARPQLPREDCLLLAEAVLGVIGHVSANSDRSASEIARFRAAVEAVLKA